MKCRGLFVFKTITFKKSGIFTNEEGKEIAYKSSYILKVDELGENGEINERKFKIPEDKITLINDLKSLETYTKIYLDFNVTLYTSTVSLEVIDVSTDIED